MKTKYGSLPFDAQIAFFKKKLALSTRTWTDIVHSNHDHAFVVAGANKQALVEDFQKSVRLAIEDGTTLTAFRKDFDRIVKAHGWEYKGSPGWRSRVIYETNIRSSYQAGRYTQLQKMDYWQYHHSPASQNPRQKHVQWDGLILPKTDPFWDTNYPPNGFGCRCTVTGHSKAAVQRKGLKIAQSPDLEMQAVTIGSQGSNPRKVTVPKGVGPGWAYPPGRDAWMRAHAIPPKGDAPWPFTRQPKKKSTKKNPARDPVDHVIPDFAAHDLLPDARPFPKSRLLPGMKKGQEAQYVNDFLKPFGAKIGKPAVFTDATGEAVVISEHMFQDHRGIWKIGQDGSRSSEMNVLAETIRNPDEIWAWTAWHAEKKKAVVNRVYLARFTINGRSRSSLVVMEHGAGWSGVTAHTSRSASELSAKVERNRRGVRLYRRPEP